MSLEYEPASEQIVLRSLMDSLYLGVAVVAAW